MEEQNIIRGSLLKIFSQSGYNDSTRMTQRDFEYIGGEIEKKSGVVISGTTIKRLSNGEFSRLPQVATLNALANYFGYSTWQEYKTSVELTVKATSDYQVKENSKRPKKLPGRILMIMTAGVLVVVAILGFLVFKKSSGAESGNFDKAVFTASKNTDNRVPNTVVFNYNIDSVNADSFFIQQSWDDRRRVRIYKNHYAITDIYYEPGYHVAKLIANDSVIKTIDISIPTDKWFFYANEYKRDYKTEYIKVDKPVSNGVMGITKETLLQNNMDINREMIYLYSYFPGRQEVSGDNFTLKTRVRMSEIRNNLCPYITLEVYCQRNGILVKSTEKGCANKAMLAIGNNVLYGESADLGAIAYNVKEWNDMELIVKDKHLSIKINEKVVYETTYERSVKNIAGLAFISNGLCEVDKVDLSGNNGKIVYKDEF